MLGIMVEMNSLIKQSFCVRSEFNTYVIVFVSQPDVCRLVGKESL